MCDFVFCDWVPARSVFFFFFGCSGDVKCSGEDLKEMKLEGQEIRTELIR